MILATDFTFGPLDPFVFYRGFEAKSPVTTAARHLSAAATRLCFSVLFGMLEVPESLWTEVRALLTARTLWGLSLVLGAWLIATVIGGPVGMAIDAVIAAYGLYELWPVIKAVASDLWQWLSESYWASTEADLKRAGQHFADALAAGSLQAFQAIVLHRVFTRVSKAMVDHFPAPEWLERRFGDLERRRQRAKDEEQQGRKTLQDRLHGAAGHVLLPAGKGVGEFPTGLVLGGTLVVVAAGTALGLLVAGEGKRHG